MYIKAMLPSGRVARVNDKRYPSYRAAHDGVSKRDRDGRLEKRFGIKLFVSSRP